MDNQVENKTVKFVQISATNDGNFPILFALGDDGIVYEKRTHMDAWRPVTNVIKHK